MSEKERSKQINPYEEEEEEGYYSEDETDEAFQRFSQEYKLLDTIGTGGFSVVKRAQSLKTSADVAVKIVRQVNAQALMDREIDIMKKAATHPNILHLFDVFQTKKNIYIVMELAEGGEVFDHIVKHGQYSERDASIIARQIVDAVKFLHDQGIAHRDLKPQNLLCSGSDPTNIRIADFGLSKVFNDKTMMRTCCGSPEYVAPEILLCMDYDKAVDMWSIGIIIYILLTGCFPFWSENVQVLYRKIINGVYKWPKAPVVSELAKDLVSRLLEKDPKKRMTAAECLDHPWIKGLSVSDVHIPRNWSEVRKRPSKKRSPAFDLEARKDGEQQPQQPLPPLIPESSERHHKHHHKHHHHHHKHKHHHHRHKSSKSASSASSSCSSAVDDASGK